MDILFPWHKKLLINGKKLLPFPYGTLSPLSMNRLYTLGAAASIEAVESEQRCHSHSRGPVPLARDDI